MPPRVSEEEEVVKRTQKNVLPLALVSVFVLAVLAVAPSAFVSAQTTSTSSFPTFNRPPCDFSDTFYQENGFAITSTTLDSPAAARFGGPSGFPGTGRQTGPPASSLNGGTLNWTPDSSCSQNDPTRRDVRILATTGAYKDDDGFPGVFFNAIAFVLNQSFFNSNFTFQQGDSTVSIGSTGNNPRGFSVQFIVSNFEAYVGVTQRISNGTLAPTPCGSLHSKKIAASDCFSVNTSDSVATPHLRQDWRISSNRNAIDGSDNNSVVGSGVIQKGTPSSSTANVAFNSPFGYFCDDLLGAWIITYFWYTENAVGGVASSDGHLITPTATCNTVLGQAAKVNGVSLDGTPIIHTGNELHFIEGVPGTAPQFGFTLDKANALLAAMAKEGPCGAEGNLDQTGADGGAVWLICPTILDPRNGAIAPDAFPDVVFTSSGAPLDPHIINNFKCLQSTGLFCDGT